MSVANSVLSTKSIGTVVGSRDPPGGKYADDVSKREVCAWFENKLGIRRYLRDKKNEERPERGTVVSVNSKLLRCSYQIPADDILHVMRNLHSVLAPGFRIGTRAKPADWDKRTEENEDRIQFEIYYDWIACSDWTAQVHPKFPSVLWFDLECMVCKQGAGGTKKEKHLKSKRIIELVVRTVMERPELRDSTDVYDTLYVTRGKTCGMHLFFPQVLLDAEADVHALWNAVNKRLSESDQPMAKVDTGCSAMPLPLARCHNGLTRVEFERNVSNGNVSTRSFRVVNLNIKDFLRVTNFYHLLRDASTSPSPSVVRDEIHTTDSKRDTGRTEKNADERATTSPAENGNEISQSPVRPCEQEQSTDTTGHGRNNGDPGSSVESDVIATHGDQESPMEIVTIDLEDHDREDDKRSTASSGSSKRLVQSDIRSVCAKAAARKRKSSTLTDSEDVVAVKRPRTDTLDPSRSERQQADAKSCSAESDCEDYAERRSKVSREYEEDTASSFLCTGYAPSLAVSSSRHGGKSAASHGGKTSRLASENDVTSFPPSEVQEATSSSDETPLGRLYVCTDSAPQDARMPQLHFRPRGYGATASSRVDRNYLRRVERAEKTFENNMTLKLDSRDNQTHETDVQLIVSSFKTEMNFYKSLVNDSTPISDEDCDRLRMKRGCSLQNNRDNCPPAMFPEHVPYVLFCEDFVSETDWTSVLLRYFDEYLNSAPFLYVMSRVLVRDANVEKNLSEASRYKIRQSVQNCLDRFKYDAIDFQNKNDVDRNKKTSNVPKHPYEEKCTVVIGLMAVCSRAYKMVTPIFTDLAKAGHLLLGTKKQTIDSLNTSTMSATGITDRRTYCTLPEEDDSFFDESATDVGLDDAIGETDKTAGDALPQHRTNVKSGVVTASTRENHSIIASILRWNFSALDDQTLWCFFYYYYHVHTDALTRIMNEVIHGGLMISALLQAYFEFSTNDASINVHSVCAQAYVIDKAFVSFADENRSHDADGSLMPPPDRRGSRKTKGGKGRKSPGGSGGGSASSSPMRDARREEFAGRSEDAKNAQRKAQEAKNGRSWAYEEEEDERSHQRGSKKSKSYYVYKTDFNETVSLIVNHYLRPVSFDEVTVVYTETGYEPCQNEFSSAFSTDKERKRAVMDLFTRSTVKYNMPHGDLLLYNTDIMGTVHRRSSCTNNLVLNIFENMYGGCMTYLTRRVSDYLKLYNRFNGDAYRLAVECRHAINEFVRSIDLSYINLILRQPIVPPVLEADITVRTMYMSDEEILKGAFVCLNTMDYVRFINMFTKHSKFSQENCKIAESFLDKLITDLDVYYDNSHTDGRTLFRTVYLFYLLYVFEVMYKIRHAYNSDGAYRVSFERLSWDVDVRMLLNLFFGKHESKTPCGLSPEVLKQLDLSRDVYDDDRRRFAGFDETQDEETDSRTAGARCISTRPLVSADVPDKMGRMMELFGKKGIHVMKSYAPLSGASDGHVRSEAPDVSDPFGRHRDESAESGGREERGGIREAAASSVERDRAFLEMTQTQLEQELYSSTKWYDNCRIRVEAVDVENREDSKAERRGNVDTCLDPTSMGTFLRTQLRVNIDNRRLDQIENSVREKKDFEFCTRLPLRTKVIALVLATHSAKRLTTDVAADFVHKEYYLERSGIVTTRRSDGTAERDEKANDAEDDDAERPDQRWEKTWKRLLCKRERLLAYCRCLADTNFSDNYFVGLQPDDTYYTLYRYMLGKSKYVTLHTLKNESWAKDVCAAFNYLLTINGYDPELVELCLRLFLGFEWPGQWAKRIFVWKSNSNAGKSFFFEHVISKAFNESTCINDPKGGKENAPEKSEYYRNFVLMINEFTSASAAELKKLCSTSSYKFRMNFANQMIKAFAVGKMVFNCNTLPLTNDHATIQRVALVPLPFWFQKRQTVVDSMLNWTRSQGPLHEYEKKFRRNISQILNDEERRFFIQNRYTRHEDDLFNRPNEMSLQLLSELSGQNTRAAMFLVQNKTSQVYMLNNPPKEAIVSGIVTVTRYFCRFRFFNNLKEPVDYSTLPSACNAATQEWQRISQPYFAWKERCNVQTDNYVRTKVSTILASLNQFAKISAKSVTFFDLRQFFEWDFAEQKIPYYSAKEDEYNVRLDPLQD